MRRLLGLTSILLLLTACNIDASITDLRSSVPAPIENLNRVDPDFVSGEVVTTGTGYRVRAVFGEPTEKQVLGNGYVVEAVIHE